MLSQFREIVERGFRILAMALQPVVVMMHYSTNEVRFCVPKDGNLFLEFDPEAGPQALERGGNPFQEVNPETSPQALGGSGNLFLQVDPDTSPQALGGSGNLFLQVDPETSPQALGGSGNLFLQVDPETSTQALGGSANLFLEVDPETSPQALEGRMLLWHIHSYVEMYASLFDESVYSLHDNINNLLGVSPIYEGHKRRSLPYDPPPDMHEEAKKKIDTMLKFLLHARDGLEKCHYDALAKSVGSHIPQLVDLLLSLGSSNFTVPSPT